MASLNSFYGIVNDKVLAKSLHTYDGDEHQIQLTRGMMVEIKDMQDRLSTIKIHDFFEKNYVYENNLYLCKTNAISSVSLEMWPFLMAINDPFERLLMARDKHYMEYIGRLRENDFVTVDGRFFSMSPINQSLSFLPERDPKDKTLDYQCAVRYIGPVDEIGIPGHLFGLELLVNL